MSRYDGLPCPALRKCPSPFRLALAGDGGVNSHSMTDTCQTVNINDSVRFRLTDEGKKMILRYHNIQAGELNLPPYDWFKYHQPDADGYYSEQLWQLMTFFGPYLQMGGPQLIEANELLIGS